MTEESIDPNIGQVESRSIALEMSESYLDYAMSVIIARALPDVRDGMKPVHRRVLYAMHQMGIRARTKHTKCAKIVGEVLGKFHPHGDQAAYDTLARMAQDFAMRYQLVDGQGNFGSMDGDSPAAMRYTEARMAPLAEEMLADIEKETVDFVPNYNNELLEPKYLPSRVPNLLLNGAVGIAVGMATTIPPHNLRELVAGITAQIDNPEITIDELTEFIQGPDFPTGGTIYDREDIKAAYATGRGRIVMRANALIEEKKTGGQQIIVSAIPYQINKADLVTKIATLVKLKKIEGIADLRDESDRNDAVRIVIELKQTAYPKKVLNRLYELTPMQTAFHVNMLALVDGIQPRVLSLKDIIQEFIEHRRQVVRRRTEFDLRKTEQRLHILLGLKTALDHIDEIITLIREAETRETAHQALREHFSLTEIQANAILDMRLVALAGLERQKVLDEILEKQTLIETLKLILGSNERVRAIIKNELQEISQKHGDDRRTTIVPTAIGEFSAEDLIPNEQVVIALTTENYIKRVPIGAYKTQHRGGKGIVGMTTKEEDLVAQLRVANTHDEILFFTSKGRLFASKVYELPATSRQAKGTPIVNIIQIAPDETVTALITLSPAQEKSGTYFFMGTRLGSIKKTEIDAYRNIRKSGIIAIGLKPNDELRWVKITRGTDKIFMITRLGQAIQFEETDTRPMGRGAAGVRGIRLRGEDEIIALDVVEEGCDVLVVLENGFGKRTKIEQFGLQNRGGIGLRAARVTKKTGPVVAAELVKLDEGEIVMISKHGQTIRLPLRAVKRLGRNTQGVTLMRFKEKDDGVASMAVFLEQ
ncbi:DNA gyrase subunit A [Candidatus Berkelbacteria bacterium]|nr:DNA gyrase subunit A [Candidatus Berkelbacteria bacterium]